MRLRGRIIDLAPIARRDVRPLLELRVRNRERLAPYEPARDRGYFTEAAQLAEVLDAERQAADGKGFTFAIRTHEDDRLVGRIALSQIHRGPQQSGILGYWIDRDVEGCGAMTEAVGLVVRFAFEELGLHRVQAAVVPSNPASARVLEKAGFEEEGYARSYLKLDGVWKDHRIFARVDDLEA
jgi:ribosomal-protein-alanine N-acetyltransferase